MLAENLLFLLLQVGHTCYIGEDVICSHIPTSHKKTDWSTKKRASFGEEIRRGKVLIMGHCLGVPSLGQHGILAPQGNAQIKKGMLAESKRDLKWKMTLQLTDLPRDMSIEKSPVRQISFPKIAQKDLSFIMFF